MKKIFSLLLMAIISVSFLSCSDDDKPGNGPLALHFDNVVGTTNLQLNTDDTPYTNSKSEAYKLTWLTYYVSNIKLKKSDGTYFTDPVKSDGSAGYYLIDENDEESQDVTLENIPAGDYTEVTFTIGVDASQVDQGAQTGALDPANNLFWSWNSGYIFLAIEGTSPASTETDNAFQYHVGGYKEDAASNQVNNIRTVALSFNGDSAPVRAQHEPEVHLLFDVNKFFNGSGEQVTFAASASRHSPKACQNLAGNIAGAFVVDHVHAN
jgi:hypothetical protein